MKTQTTNGLLTLTGGSPHFRYGIMTNAGTIQLLNGSGDLVLNGSCQAAGAVGQLVNLPGALVDVQGSSSITWQCGTELVVNQGVLRKSGGTGTTTINAKFNNGAVQANCGKVSFGNAFIQNAGKTVLNGGAGGVTQGINKVEGGMSLIIGSGSGLWHQGVRPS